MRHRASRPRRAVTGLVNIAVDGTRVDEQYAKDGQGGEWGMPRDKCHIRNNPALMPTATRIS